MKGTWTVNAETSTAERPEVDPPDQEPINAEHLRMMEALLFAAAEPLDEKSLRERLPEDANLEAILAQLIAEYDDRGVNLVQVAGKWAFRTSEDLSFLMRREVHRERRLSRAATETLAIIAYHQPVTRAEIEEIRGVVVSRGTLDVLMETTWIRPVGKRRTPGQPVTYGTTSDFLEHFGFNAIADLPGVEELKAAGLLDSALPEHFRKEETLPIAGSGDGDEEVPNPLHEAEEELDLALENDLEQDI